MITHKSRKGKMHTLQRIAKSLSRAGIASRREAEKLVLRGSISINGQVIRDPATKVNRDDTIRVNGKLIDAPESTRVWRYHKPVGLVTTNSDEKGRPTIFEKLPLNLPRVMSVGRLDISSEGLLLLTNDGALKRHLELPVSGFIRKYRVRVKGSHNDLSLERLRLGVSINGFKFRPMEVKLDCVNGANVWYTVVLKEGRNREIRRAFDKINMTVNRLIRTNFGAFQLGLLPSGQIEEIPTRVLQKFFKVKDS